MSLKAMPLALPSCTFDEEICMPVVKNTFLTLQQHSPCANRRLSIPASLRLCVEKAPRDEKDCQRESAKHRACSDASTAFGTDIDDEDAVLRSDSGLTDVSSRSNLGSRGRSNSKESANSNPQPQQTCGWEPWMRYPYDFAKVIKRTIRLMQESELIASVEKSQSPNECILTIRMSAEGACQKDQVLAVAQKALLDIAVPCKSIYIVGFRSPSPFVPTASGFDVKYGAMGNANAACWHYFKRGFCRYGDTCRKQHAIWEMPTRVLIEDAFSEPQNAWAQLDIKNEM
jgi:hypothetical protein